MPLNKKEINISSDTLQLKVVEDFIHNVFDSYNLSNTKFAKTILCIKEAVTNSIIHGNRFDKDKSINISAYKCNKYLYFKIIDQGEGFNYNEKIDPLKEENISKEGGRGLFIIKNLCEKVYFKDKGNIIELRISLDESN